MSFAYFTGFFRLTIYVTSYIKVFMTLFDRLGRMAIGTRVRFMSDLITSDAARIYKLYGIDMNPKWFPVFYILTQEKEKTITAIAEAIGHSHVSVSKIVAEMKKAKVVSEKTSTQDRRKTMVKLTQRGLDMASKIQEQYRDVREAVETMSRESQHDLWAALQEWEHLFQTKSLYERVQEKKKEREAAEVKIVNYAPKYRAAFRDLNLEWITKYFKIEQADRDALDDPKGYILERGGHIFVALLNGEPVGVCALIQRKDKHYPLELAKMAVSPKAQGKGVGLLLGNAIVKKARMLKAKKLYLESNTVLTPAISLYKKLGFVKVEGLKTPYERCNIHMELDLK